MATNEHTQELIASTLALPFEQRLAVMGAIHVSLADRTLDHGPAESTCEATSAWREEIARRIAELDPDCQETISAEEAEGMIRGDGEPAV